MTDEHDEKLYVEAIERLTAALAVSDGEGYDELVAAAHDGGFVEYPVAGLFPLITARGVSFIGALMDAAPPSVRHQIIHSLIYAGAALAATAEPDAPVSNDEAVAGPN